MSGSTPGSNLVVVLSKPNSNVSSRGGSAHSSRPGTAHGNISQIVTNGLDSHHSTLNSATTLSRTDDLKNDWRGYLHSVNQVAELIVPGDLSNDWQKSVIDPFKPNWGSIEYSTYPTLIARFEHAADKLRRNLRPGQLWDGHEIIFSGYLSHFIIEDARGLEAAPPGVDLRSKLKSAFDRACAQAPSETHLYESIYDRMKQLWHVRTPTRAQQQLAVNILEHSIVVLGGVILRQQIARPLLYLWVPETEIVCEALGLDYVPTASPSPSPSMHSSNSLARSGTVLSHRKKLLYFS
ncbi:hypothetical protein JCM5350_006089 [Sporobolomyces pararoseus]